MLSKIKSKIFKNIIIYWSSKFIIKYRKGADVNFSHSGGSNLFIYI
jgi:hypothetical protein